MEKVISGRRIFVGNKTQTATNELSGRLIVVSPEIYLYESDNGTYQVNYSHQKKTCTCQDFMRHMKLQHTGKFTSDKYLCKHILAVESMCGLATPDVIKTNGIITLKDPSKPISVEQDDILLEYEEWGYDAPVQTTNTELTDDAWIQEEQ